MDGSDEAAPNGAQNEGAQVPPDTPTEKLLAELASLAKTCRHRAESQITACGFWGNFQLLVGGFAAVTAASAGATAFADHTVVAGSLAVAASVSTAVVASVKAGDRATEHERFANEFHLLSGRASRMLELTSADTEPAYLRQELDSLVADYEKLSRDAPFVNRRLVALGLYFLNRGRSYFEPDPGLAERSRRDRGRAASFLRRLWP